MYNDGSSGSDDCRFLDIPILPTENLVRVPPPPEPTLHKLRAKWAPKVRDESSPTHCAARQHGQQSAGRPFPFHPALCGRLHHILPDRRDYVRAAEDGFRWLRPSVCTLVRLDGR